MTTLGDCCSLSNNMLAILSIKLYCNLQSLQTSYFEQRCKENHVRRDIMRCSSWVWLHLDICESGFIGYMYTNVYLCYQPTHIQETTKCGVDSMHSINSGKQINLYIHSFARLLLLKAVYSFAYIQTIIRICVYVHTHIYILI